MDVWGGRASRGKQKLEKRRERRGEDEGKEEGETREEMDDDDMKVEQKHR